MDEEEILAAIDNWENLSARERVRFHKLAIRHQREQATKILRRHHSEEEIDLFFGEFLAQVVLWSAKDRSIDLYEAEKQKWERIISGAKELEEAIAELGLLEGTHFLMRLWEKGDGALHLSKVSAFHGSPHERHLGGTMALIAEVAEEKLTQRKARRGESASHMMNNPGELILLILEAHRVAFPSDTYSYNLFSKKPDSVFSRVLSCILPLAGFTQTSFEKYLTSARGIIEARERNSWYHTKTKRLLKPAEREKLLSANSQ